MNKKCTQALNDNFCILACSRTVLLGLFFDFLTELSDGAKAANRATFFMFLITEFMTCDLATFWATYKIAESSFCRVMLLFSLKTLTKPLLLLCFKGDNSATGGQAILG